MIYVHINELETLAEICYHLTKNGAAYKCHLNGNQWEIEITGY